MTINDPAISEQGTCEEEQVTRITWFYYHDRLTRSKINGRLGPTRLKASRLLEKGHQPSIIRVQINSHSGGCLEYETQLRRQLSLQHVRVIPGPADADVGGRLGMGAAHMLISLFQPQQVLATGLGEATMNALQRLSGFTLSQQVRLVMLSDSVGSYMTGIGQSNAACNVNIIPAPSQTPSADIVRTLKNESCVKDVPLAAQAADVAIIGIGTVSQQDDAAIIRSDCINQDEQLMIGREGAVDDILGYFFDTKDNVVMDIRIHNELIGLPLSALKTIPARVGVAGGEDKTEATVAVTRGDCINTLVTDQGTAAAILHS